MVVAPPPTASNSLATVCGRGTTGLQVTIDGNRKQERVVSIRRYPQKWEPLPISGTHTIPHTSSDSLWKWYGSCMGMGSHFWGSLDTSLIRGWNAAFLLEWPWFCKCFVCFREGKFVWGLLYAMISLRFPMTWVNQDFLEFHDFTIVGFGATAHYLRKPWPENCCLSFGMTHITSFAIIPMKPQLPSLTHWHCSVCLRAVDFSTDIFWNVSNIGMPSKNHWKIGES